MTLIVHSSRETDLRVPAAAARPIEWQGPVRPNRVSVGRAIARPTASGQKMAHSETSAETGDMGLIHTDIELSNGVDLALSRLGKLPEDDIRKMKVQALVDSGALMLVINERIRDELGLLKVEERVAEYADGSTAVCDVVGPIEVCIPNRRCSVDALVLPGDCDVLLGAVPMEDMDLIIDPKSNTVRIDPNQPQMSKKPVK
jgi:clan AA aspartic protease